MVRGMRTAVALGALAAGLGAAGCGGEKSTGPRPIAGTVALAPGAYAFYAGAQAAGPLVFPAADSTGADYLIVGQLATGVADLSAAFALGGETPGAPAAARAAAAPARAPRVPFALRFHDTLRGLDAAAALASLALPAPPPAAAPHRGPPALNTQRTFVVCADANCATTTTATATVQYVGTHSAIYVDDSVPPNGFTSANLQALGAQFDSALYPVDTVAFGGPSDVDGNGVVLILLTPKVNALTPPAQCGTSYVTGFFLGFDLAPATRRVYNDGEIFYGMVPDPAGQVACPFSVTQALQLIPPTFIHEFQHMISFNQHVLLRNGTTEVLWLNEGLSRLAEELGGLHYDSLNDATDAANFFSRDFVDAFDYLLNPAVHPMVTLASPGSLEARGAEWLFVRYLVDQFGPALTQRLVQTAQVGDANVVAATGTAFATLLGRWALALYVSDLPGFTADSTLRYRTWSFRATFASLHAFDPTDFFTAFPLTPASTSAPAFSLGGTAASGSPVYLLLTRPPGAAALNLAFTTPGGGALPAGGNPQLTIVRLR